MGKIGSCVVLVRSRHISQAIKTIQRIPDSTNVDMVVRLFHGYLVPPDSRAKTRSTDAAKRENMPMKSTFRIVSRENLACILEAKSGWPPPSLEGKNISTSRMLKAPGGPLRMVNQHLKG